MSFLESYKHLEKLCGEVMSDERRISAYIDEMANTPRGPYLVPGWDADLKRLKYYKRIRNQIAHDPDCNESNMCDPGDAEWLEDFYSRIINQTDPLALYAQAVRYRPTENVKQMNEYTPKNDSGATSKRTMGYLLLCIFALAVLLIALIGAKLT